jgi:hypothetical protein
MPKRHSPAAMRGSQCARAASSPISAMTVAAAQTVVKNGAHSKRRPACSWINTNSTGPSPRPPYSSAIATPHQPSSPAMRCQTAGS